MSGDNVGVCLQLCSIFSFKASLCWTVTTSSILAIIFGVFGFAYLANNSSDAILFDWMIGILVLLVMNIIIGTIITLLLWSFKKDMFDPDAKWYYIPS